ncbi:MAG: amidohydrolase family protein, partial [Acidimicrobiales bacterium]
MRTLIRGGTVVSALGASLTDVVIDGDKIAALVAPGSDTLGSLPELAERVIDATGRYVVPGGVDGHTHMEMPFGGTTASDTFETGTRAAAWGGTTTIIDFIVHHTGTPVLDGIVSWHEKAAGNCAIDYGFHQILAAVDDESLKAMDALM